MEPTGRLSLYDLLLRVAKAGGVAYYGSTGQGTAKIPIDVGDLDRCLSVVNDGVRLFMSSAPPQGWRWQNRLAEIVFGTEQIEGTATGGSALTLVDSDLTDTYDTNDDLKGYYAYDLTKELYALCTGYTALSGTVTVGAWKTYDDRTTSLYPASGDSYSLTDVKTVCGDITRYFLPDDFAGDVSGQITYAPNSNRGHIIDWCGEGTIRQNQEVSVSTGYPMYAAVRPSPVRRKWELVVDPSPAAADTVVFPYRVGFNEFQALSGTATAGCGAKALVDSSLATQSYPNSYFVGWTAEIVGGTGIGSYAVITGYTASSGTFAVAGWLAVDGTSTGVSPDTGSIYYLYDGYTQPAGLAFDQAVLSACLAVAETEFEDLQLGYTQRFYQVDLPKAYELDARSAPRKLGVIKPDGGVRRLATWNDVGYLAEHTKSY